jgi:serine phosphatase RsbU (regulator of sigma subunit)
MCINQPGNPQALALGLSAEQAIEKIKELDTRIGALEIERAEAVKMEKSKAKPGRKRMPPNEVSEKARKVFQEASDNAPDKIKQRGDQELEDLQRKSEKLEVMLKEARAKQLQKKIEEQERELRELGVDPDQVVNG